MTIRGTFADGSRLTAIPNFARYNRNPPVAATAPPAPAAPGAPAVRPPRPPATSIIWMKEL